MKLFKITDVIAFVLNVLRKQKLLETVKLKIYSNLHIIFCPSQNREVGFRNEFDKNICMEGSKDLRFFENSLFGATTVDNSLVSIYHQLGGIRMVRKNSGMVKMLILVCNCIKRGLQNVIQLHLDTQLDPLK